MKIRLLMLVILPVVTATHGQVIKKCDGTILLLTSRNVGQLSQNEILNFLMTFGSECRDNVEFSEWSNELLFDILDKQTEATVKTLEREESNVDLDVILDELASPINDGINVTKLIPKVEKVKINDLLKKEILARLKIAEESMN